MAILVMILALILQCAFGGVALFLGSKITRADVNWPQAFLIALAGALVGLVPFVGWLASWIVMLWLLNKWCDCEPIPERSAADSGLRPAPGCSRLQPEDSVVLSGRLAA